MVEREFERRPRRELTVPSLLADRAAALGDRTCLHYGPDELDLGYAELDELANGIGDGLRKLGVEPGSNVSVMMSGPLSAFLASCGIAKAGAVYSPINFEYRGEPLAYQIDDTAPAALVVEDRYLERIASIRGELETLPLVIARETDAAADADEYDFVDARFSTLREPTTAAPPVDVEWDDPASIVYTSGTTGKPKGVVLPHRWIFANYTAKRAAILGPGDTVHTSLPLYHVAGLYWDIVSALVAGASVAVWDRFSPEAFWDRIDRYEATTATLLSVMTSWLANTPERPDDRRNTLTKVQLQPLPEEYASFAERFGFDFITVGFGQTECGGPIGGIVEPIDGEGTPPELWRGPSREDVREGAGSIGIPVVDRVPGDRYMGRPREDLFEVAVLDERDERLLAGETGELAVRPKLPGIVLREYHDKPDRTVEAFGNLWFHTGDAVYRDETGNYFYVDRLGDVIRRRGENISSLQIQETIVAHEAVESAAVVPIPAEEGGEDEIAAAVVADGVTEDELRSFLDGRLPAFMQPKRIRFVEEMPTTETNKVEKYRFKERFSESDR